MTTSIRDALEEVLQAGVEAWGLNISEAELGDGARCFEDDQEILTMAGSLEVPEKVLTTLPLFLEQHQGILDSREARQILQQCYLDWAEPMVHEVLAALTIVGPLLRQEVDPEYFSGALGTIIYLGMVRFCPGVPKLSELPDESAGSPLSEYIAAIVKGGWPEMKRFQTRIMNTQLGRLIDGVVSRQARRAFTLLVAGDRTALAMVLSQIIEEVKHADNRTDTGSHEVHEEET